MKVPARCRKAWRSEVDHLLREGLDATKEEPRSDEGYCYEEWREPRHTADERPPSPCATATTRQRHRYHRSDRCIAAALPSCGQTARPAVAAASGGRSDCYRRVIVPLRTLQDASDCYGGLEAPRPGLQAAMRRALLAEEGALARMVLEGTTDLSLAVPLCLEVLGIGTSTAEQQAAAARALVALCTHEQLRPAVDNLLVLRRLGRIIELTKSATALAEAAEALFAIADDTAWESKNGSVAEALRDALQRCVTTMTASTKALRATAALKDASRAEYLALAAAAGAALRSRALHLLSTPQLVEAAGALGACLACGCEGPQVLAALAAVLKHCKAELGAPLHVAAAAAVADAGAAEVLLRAISGGTHRKATKGVAGGPRRSCPSNAGEFNQPTAAARDAFACLTDVLMACGGAGSSGEQAAAWGSITGGFKGLAATGAAALVPLLWLLEAADAGRALHALLVLWRCCSENNDECNEMFTEVLSLVAEDDGGAAFLRAVGSLLAGRPGLVAADAGLLMELCAGLLTAGYLPGPEVLCLEAPGLVEAAVGVLMGAAPAPAWSAFEPLAVTSSPGAKVSYPGISGSDVAALVCKLLECAAGADCKSPLRTWLPAAASTTSSIARVLAARLTGAAMCNAEVRCLALALQQAPPEEVWAGEHYRTLEPLASATKAALVCGTEDTRVVAHAQLAAAVLMSGWATSGYPHCCRGNVSTNSYVKRVACIKCSACRALLELATALLKQQVSQSAATLPADEQLAALGGALNAVIACLNPWHALAGAAAQPLCPGLPEDLLNALKCAGPLAAGAAALSYYTKRSGKRQLRWFFETPTDAHDSSFGNYLNAPSVASGTALPLLRAMAAAAQQINKLAAAAAAAVPGSEGQEATVVRAGLHVAGCVALLLCDCYPPPEGA